MRIGIDGGCWANSRGYGRYIRELLTEMVKIAPHDQFVFFLDPASSARFHLEGTNVKVVHVAQSEAPSQAAAADGARSPFDMLRFTRAVWSERLDVFFYPSVYTYFPLPPGRAAVVAIHDAIAERFPERTLPSKRARLFWTLKVRMAVAQSRLVLSVSDFAADDVSRVIGVPRQRIRVATEAPADTYRPSESEDRVRTAARGVGLPDDAEWFIYVGGFSPHKNLDVLVRAFSRVVAAEPSDGPPAYLLLVGAVTGDVFHGSLSTIRQVIADRGVEERVLWPGYVADEELRHLHSGALALVLPSDCEGFGLPAVEAAACGTAVVATTQSPLPSLLAGGGIFVEPRDEGALANAMQTIRYDVEARRNMGLTALQRARDLSWTRCAEEALDAIREAAA